MLPVDEQKYGLKFLRKDSYILIIKNVDERDECRYYCSLYLTLYVRVYDSIFVKVVGEFT